MKKFGSIVPLPLEHTKSGVFRMILDFVAKTGIGESIHRLMVVRLQLLNDLGFVSPRNEILQKSSIKWMDTAPNAACRLNSFGYSLILCFTAAIECSVRTVQRLWGCPFSTRVNVVWNQFMVARTNDSVGRLCRPHIGRCTRCGTESLLNKTKN